MPPRERCWPWGVRPKRERAARIRASFLGIRFDFQQSFLYSEESWLWTLTKRLEGRRWVRGTPARGSYRESSDHARSMGWGRWLQTQRGCFGGWRQKRWVGIRRAFGGTRKGKRAAYTALPRTLPHTFLVVVIQMNNIYVHFRLGNLRYRLLSRILFSAFIPTFASSSPSIHHWYLLNEWDFSNKLYTPKESFEAQYKHSQLQLWSSCQLYQISQVHSPSVLSTFSPETLLSLYASTAEETFTSNESLTVRCYTSTLISQMESSINPSSYNNLLPPDLLMLWYTRTKIEKIAQISVADRKPGFIALESPKQASHHLQHTWSRQKNMLASLRSCLAWLLSISSFVSLTLLLAHT